MIVESTRLPDLLLLKPTIYDDTRGYFIENYHRKQWVDIGLPVDFVQENHSCSQKGVVRGLHYQLEPHAQSKWVHVLYGAIWDVVVDLRQNMPTFGQWQGFLLDDINHHQLFIPKGFAHGFIALIANTILSYKCDNYYCPEAERGIHFQDPTLGIPWENYAIPTIVSEKDRNLPLFNVNYRL